MAGFIAFTWSSIETVAARREMAQQTAESHCEESSNDSCEALEADIRAAAAAEASADLTGQQLWLNFIGLLGLGATVIYARAAWIAAHRSAEAAETALAEADRPHIAVTEVRLTNIEPPDDANAALPKFGLHHAFRNFGNGIGWITEVSMFLCFSDPGELPDKESKNSAVFYYWPLPPNHTWGTTEDGIQFDGKRELREGVARDLKNLYVIGRVTYSDIGKKAHRQTFAYKYIRRTGKCIPWDNPEYWDYT